MAHTNISSAILRLLNGAFDDFGSWLQKPNIEYSAKFEKYADLSRFNHGIAIGAKSTKKSLAVQHAICTASSGAGKTSIFVIPSIISLSRGRSSLIINDVKGGELYGFTSGYLEKLGYNVMRVDFRNPKESECFNPLDFIGSESDIYMIATLIYMNAGGDTKGDNFWQHSTIMLLSLLIRYFYQNAERKYLTLQNIMRLTERMAYDLEVLHRLFSKVNDPELISAYKATIGMTDKTLQSVVTTLRSILRLWSDKHICATTSNTSFRFEELREKPVAIYVTTPIQDLNYTRSITALFFNSLFNWVLSNKPEKRSIFFVLDEFATYTFPEFSTTIATIRSQNAGFLLCLQDEIALNARYSSTTAQLILSNCSTKIYLPGLSAEICKKISGLLGKFSVPDTLNKTRELLTPDEVRRCEKAIVFIKNAAPMQMTLVPHYKNIWMSGITKMPPKFIEPKHPFEPAIFPL